MKNFLSLVVAIVAILGSSSCAFLENFNSKKDSTSLDYIKNSSFKMDIKKFFNGDLEAFAIKQNASGKIIGTFTIKISGKWDENKGTVQQNFIYDDGTKDNRTWLITLDSDGTFNAVGHDVFVPAQGKQMGNAAQSNYTLILPSKNGKEEIIFEDKMYLVDEKSMIMISKFDNKKADPSSENSSGKTIISIKKAGN
jgi:hypothetical protein